MAENLDFNYLSLNLKRNEILSLRDDVNLGKLERLKYKDGIQIKSKNVIIDGNGHTIDAKGKVRFFNVLEEGSLTIKNLNFKNGFTEKHGGAIRNGGKCKLINCTFENNKAKKNGDDISNGSDLTITQCNFSKNNSIFNEYGSVYFFEDEGDDLKPFISGGKINIVGSFKLGDDLLNASEEDISLSSEPSLILGNGDDSSLSQGTSPIIAEEGNGAVTESSDGVVLSHKYETPFDAYDGDGPYIFISYKHSDSNIVYPLISKLHDEGFDIWYDDGLPLGKNYDIQIVKHIKNTSLFITFITETSMACAYNEEDYLIKEFSIARHFEKPILPIYLEDIELDGYYLIHLLGIQGIYKHEYHNEELFIKACVDAFIKEFNLKRRCPK